MQKQKRVVAIHDISCVGRCSVTVALPILSAAGFETSVLPTALLSTHTGDFTGYTYHDLTQDMQPISNHWKSLKLGFDAIYSGFLGSFEQIEIVKRFISDFNRKDTFVMIDPVMGDKGVLYSTYTEPMVQGMRTLCKGADIILPNLTEASLLLGEEFARDGFSKVYIEKTVRNLAELGAKNVVLTGVSLEIGTSGAVAFDSAKNEISYSVCPKVPGFFHGTGDVFASTLLAALLKKFSLKEAAQIATEITYKAILFTEELETERRYGVCFECAIPELIRKLDCDVYKE